MHGLYAKHLGKEELIEFEEFAARFELARVREEDKFAFYRVYKARSLPGPLPLPVLARAVLSLCRAKATLLSALKEQTVRLRIEGADVDAVLTDVARILVKYVPDDRVETALADLGQIQKCYCEEEPAGTGGGDGGDFQAGNG
jgi:hypothetical protein